MDKKKTWEQVDQIIKVLNVGCRYLDFPIQKQNAVFSTDERQKQLDRAEIYGEEAKKRNSPDRDDGAGSPPMFDGDLEDIAEDENGEGSFTNSSGTPSVSENEQKSNSGIEKLTDMGGSRLGPNSGMGELDLDSP